MQEHVSDPYVRRAQAQGLRSRAAFKLLELDAKDHLFSPGQTVVDLGAAPGSWSEVAVRQVGPSGRVIAIDLLDMAPITGVTFIRGDFAEQAGLEQLEAALGGRKGCGLSRIPFRAPGNVRIGRVAQARRFARPVP